MAFDPNKLAEAKKAKFDPNRLSGIKKQPGFIERMATPQAALEILSAPLELVGESIRVPVEKTDGFRAPSIVQRAFPSTKTAQPPSIGVDVANKLLRAGGGFISGVPGGLDQAKQSALSAYQADRGILGTVEDTAASLLTGRVPLGGTTLPDAPLKAAMEGIKKVSSAAGKTAKAVGKGAIRVGFGPTAQEQSLLFRRPQEVKNAPDFDELSDKFASTVNDLSKRVGELDDAAWDSLLTLKAEPRSKIINTLKQARKEFVGTGKTRIGDADKKAVAQIDRYIERVSEIKQRGVDPKLDQMLDQRQIRELVQSIRKDTRFDLPDTDPVNRAVQSVQAKIDATLKENGNYAEVMGRLAPATRALKDAASKFRLKREPGVGFIPSNTTVQQLSLATRKKRPETKRALDQLKQQTGQDFMDQVKLTGAKEAFEPGTERSRGSARTALGALVGLAAEPFIPGQGFSTLVCVGLGRAADYYGGAAGGKVIDLLRTISRKSSNLTAPMAAARNSPSGSALIDLIRQLSQKGGIPALSAGLR